jgi:hypothetical protein
LLDRDVGEELAGLRVVAFDGDDLSSVRRGVVLVGVLTRSVSGAGRQSPAVVAGGGAGGESTTIGDDVRP